MTAGNVTTTTAAAFIPEIWSADVLLAIEEKLVMSKLVTSKYDSEISKFGDTVHIPYVQNLDAADKSASTEVTFSTNTEGCIDLVINKHKYVAVRIEDIAKIQSKPDLRGLYTEKIGYALQKAIDTDLLGLYSGCSVTKGYVTSKITLNTILDCMQSMDENSVPEDNRYAVISAAQKRALLEIPEMIRNDYRGDANALKTAQLGSLLGFQFFWTNNVVKTSSSTISHNLFFHKEAYALAIQNGPRMNSAYNIRALADELVGDVLYGVGEIKDDTVLGKYAIHVQAYES